MLSKNETVPPYNRYDNIWELKQNREVWYCSRERIDKAIVRRPEWPFSVDKIGKGIIFSHAENFVYAVAKAAGRIAKYEEKPTVWKIMCSDLDNPKIGTIYYIVETRLRSLVFCATYGYLGEGPWEAAFVELCLEKLGLHFEIRDGSYLLNFF